MGDDKPMKGCCLKTVYSLLFIGLLIKNNIIMNVALLLPKCIDFFLGVAKKLYISLLEITNGS